MKQVDSRLICSQLFGAPKKPCLNGGLLVKLILAKFFASKHCLYNRREVCRLSLLKKILKFRCALTIILLMKLHLSGLQPSPIFLKWLIRILREISEKRQYADKRLNK